MWHVLHINILNIVYTTLERTKTMACPVNGRLVVPVLGTPRILQRYHLHQSLSMVSL